MEVLWTEKRATRLAVRYIKLGSEIDPTNVVSCGNRKLSAVERVTFRKNGEKFEIRNVHAPLVCSDANILRFDDRFPDFRNDGVAFLLHDNVWGTNFPLWYGGPAKFVFEIKRSED